MKLWRSMLAKLGERELGVLGDELAKLQTAHEDLQTRLEAFDVRFERIRARVGMRHSRATRGDLPEPRDEFARLLNDERGGRMRDDEDDRINWTTMPR